MTKLYKSKKINRWTVGKLNEVLAEEWAYLNPTITKGVYYSRKGTIFTFPGEINISIELIKEPRAQEGCLNSVMSLSFSPSPFSLETHVLNTFSFHYFISVLPEYSGKRVFTIGTQEPWEESVYSRVVRDVGLMIQVMQNFTNCFDILTKDTFLIGNRKLDLKDDGFEQYLMRIKAYRLAEIYGHPEKFTEALNAIQKSIEENSMAHENFVRISQSGGMDWLYTPEIIHELRSRNTV